MATNDLELDVDYIGGQGTLTAAEEKTISEFIKKHRTESKHLPIKRSPRGSRRTKAAV